MLVRQEHSQHGQQEGTEEELPQCSWIPQAWAEGVECSAMACPGTQRYLGVPARLVLQQLEEGEQQLRQGEEPNSLYVQMLHRCAKLAVAQTRADLMAVAPAARSARRARGDAIPHVGPGCCQLRAQCWCSLRHLPPRCALL